MGMISEIEAQAKGICMFCQHGIKFYAMNDTQAKLWKETSLCASCRDDLSKLDAVSLSKEDQLDFKLSDKNPIPIDILGATNMGWLTLNHPKIFIGSHITCKNYGLSVKFTIIPPTKEAGERIVNTMRTDRETRNRKLRPGHKRNAPSRYIL